MRTSRTTRPTPGSWNFASSSPTSQRAFADCACRSLPRTSSSARARRPIIWNLLTALLDPGDEMVFAEPAYPTYAAAAEYLRAVAGAGAAARIAQVQHRSRRARRQGHAADESPDHQQPEQSHRRRLTREDLAAIADLAEKFPRFVILTDEIYSRNIYGDRLRIVRAVRAPARSHDRRRRVFESLRDDGLAPWLLPRSAGDRARRNAARQQHLCVRVDVRPKGRHGSAQRSGRTGRRDERDLSQRGATCW